MTLLKYIIYFLLFYTIYSNDRLISDDFDFEFKELEIPIFSDGDILDNPYYDYTERSTEDINIPFFTNHLNCSLKPAFYPGCDHSIDIRNLMNQCIETYEKMSLNADNVCSNDLNVNKTSKLINPYLDIDLNIENNKYKEEKCLQKSYLSITEAMVMCLSENYMKFIFQEHYSNLSMNNPIEGPTLYIKKLNSFLHDVVLNTGDKAKINYPNLWLPFQDDDNNIIYNPDSPYEFNLLESSNKNKNNINLPIYSNISLLKDIFNDKDNLICENINNISTLDNDYNNILGRPYINDISNSFYSLNTLKLCAENDYSYGFHLLDNKIQNIAKYCQYTNNTVLNENNTIYSADITLRNLYDVTNKNQDKNRIRSIAEEFILGQNNNMKYSLLSGFGLFSFAAFHACKANFMGNVKDNCFPAINNEKDWNIPEDITNIYELNRLSEKINTCLINAELTQEKLIKNNNFTIFLNDLQYRSQICSLEKNILSLFDQIFDIKNHKLPMNQSWQILYFREIILKKCNYMINDKNKCKTDRDLYRDLLLVLHSLLDQCNMQ